MMKKVLALCLSGYSALAIAGFDVVALGVDGGVSDGNLTSYLIRSDNQPQYVALDAGSLLPGIAKGLEKGSFPQVTPELAAPYTPQGYVFRQLIGSYFISHGHLDHVAGLIVGSPEDNKKTVYAQADTVLTLRTITLTGRPGRTLPMPAMVRGWAPTGCKRCGRSSGLPSD